MRLTLRSCVAGLASIVAASALDCRVKDTLDERPWPCERGSPTDECGTKDGRRMACWQGYCTPSCDAHAAPPAGFACLPSGVLLQTCQPSLDGAGSDAAVAGGAHACPPYYSCYRTDLLKDEGLCVVMQVCNADKDCTDSYHTTCASTILNQLAKNLGGVGPFATDHLLCVQRPCESAGSQCAASRASESCLPKEYSVREGTTDLLSDMCVPNCGATLECPPNFACAQSAAAPGALPICLPGLTGIRCTNELDCLVGSCEDTGAGFSVCTRSCDTDQDCALLNLILIDPQPSIANLGAYFLCAGAANGNRHCLTARPFQGTACKDSSECPVDPSDGTQLECFQQGPYDAIPSEGQCRRPCKDGICPARGGLPHVCLGDAEGCFPGNVGLPCGDSTQCIAPSQCLPQGSSTSTCTVSCSDDASCDAQLVTSHTMFCADDKLCELRKIGGKPCARAAECWSQNCLGDGTCAN